VRDRFKFNIVDEAHLLSTPHVKFARARREVYRRPS
jgi:hypothetical protein